jgi:hypothetical protein
MKMEGLVSEHVVPIAVIQPQAITAGATGVLTAAIDMANYEKVMAVLLTGTLGTSGTLDFHAEASATSGGTYATITGKEATQLVKASNDNDIVIIEVTQADVAELSKRYVKFNAIAGTANATSGVLVLGVPRHYDADLVDSADIVQVVY